MADCCECGNEPSGYTKCGEVLDYSTKDSSVDLDSGFSRQKMADWQIKDIKRFLFVIK